MIAAPDILVALGWTAPPRPPADLQPGATFEERRAQLMALFDEMLKVPRQFNPGDKIRIVLPPR